VCVCVCMYTYILYYLYYVCISWRERATAYVAAAPLGGGERVVALEKGVGCDRGGIFGSHRKEAAWRAID